jgi:V/A-type H+/Na+-transporting ATPase subunit C
MGFAMAEVMINDLDYLAARIHARRGRVAEAERLDALCQLRTISELADAVFPGSSLQTSAEFQRWILEGLLSELSHYPRYLDEAGGDLLTWMLVRFQVENLKVLLRGFLEHAPIEVLREHLVSLPRDLALNANELLAAGTLEEFLDRLPMAVLRKTLRVAGGTYRDHRRPFFLEAALDQGYFKELLVRAGRVSEEDQEVVAPIIEQEVNLFLLMLIVRGRFGYGLNPELLLPLHIRSPGIPIGHFNAMLTAPDLRTAAAFGIGRVIDALPPEHESGETAGALDVAELEALAWKRFRRLANRAFRKSHMGLGAIIGYVGIRRVEVANLITLSEGIRAGVPPESIRARLIPRRDREVAYV